MSYTFRVIFDGVLAYVPDKPFFEPCKTGKYGEEKKPPYHVCTAHECCTIDGCGQKVCYKCDHDDNCEVCWKKRDERIDPNDPMSGPVRSLAVLVPDLRRSSTPKVPRSSSTCCHHCKCCHPECCHPEHCHPECRHSECCHARSDSERHQLNFPKFREPHFPLLRFRLGDLRSSTTRRVDLVCRDISRQDEAGLLFLRREQIRFNMEAENAKSFSFADWAPCPPPTYDKLPDYLRNQPKPSLYLPDWWGTTPDLRDREQIESLWWLPDLARIVKNDDDSIRAKHEVLPSYRGPFPEGLIARIECSGGRLRTYDFNRDVDGVPVKWSFVPPHNFEDRTWNRALANSLALEFFDVRDEVRIELKRLANEVIVEELVLAPGPGASRPVLEIEITNREPDLLFQEESFNRSALPDMDFQPFYEFLSQTQKDIAELPMPFPHRESFFGVVEKPCAGTGMKGQGPK